MTRPHPEPVERGGLEAVGARSLTGLGKHRKKIRAERDEEERSRCAICGHELVRSLGNDLPVAECLGCLADRRAAEEGGR